MHRQSAILHISIKMGKQSFSKWWDKNCKNCQVLILSSHQRQSWTKARPAKICSTAGAQCLFKQWIKLTFITSICMHTNTCQGLHFMKQDSYVNFLRLLAHLENKTRKNASKINSDCWCKKWLLLSLSVYLDFVS